MESWIRNMFPSSVNNVMFKGGGKKDQNRNMFISPRIISCFIGYVIISPHDIILLSPCNFHFMKILLW